jgi:predicted phage replisome organizer
MAEVKWIKITTDMFDNRKIKHLRRLPEGNSIVLIWVMLLTMAGRCNASGMIFLTENIPYSPKMLADELGFEENTVKLALQALENFNMIVSDGNYFSISGWEEYQNTDRLSEIREYNRLAKQKSRAKQKALEAPADVNDKSMTSQRCHETDIDKEEDKEKELERDIIDYSSIVELFHSICKSFPKVRSLSDARKKAIRARLKTYSMDDFRTVFQNAENSSFLKGKNDRNWSASFDWLIADKNMAKVLEGQYADRGRKEKLPDWFGKRELDEDEVYAINRMLSEPDDETEQLRRELQNLGGKSG